MGYLDWAVYKLDSNKTIEPVTGCWLWRGPKTGSGLYGQMHLLGFKRPYRVHRVAAHIYMGFDLDSPLFVCHKCDNGLCFNPEHLFIGTDSDNLLDCVSKGRHHEAKQTHCYKGHEFAPENTYWQGKKRSCKTCRRNTARQFYRERIAL